MNLSSLVDLATSIARGDAQSATSLTVDPWKDNVTYRSENLRFLVSKTNLVIADSHDVFFAGSPASFIAPDGAVLEDKLAETLERARLECAFADS